MKRVFQFLSVLLVLMMTFLTAGCSVTTYYTYEAIFFVAPIAQDNTIRSEHYDFEQMMEFLDKMCEDKTYCAELTASVAEELGEDAQRSSLSLEERIQEAFSARFENNTNLALNGVEVNATIRVRVAVAGDKIFRDALAKAVKESAEAYIEANLAYPSDCIGTHCEFVSDQKGIHTQLDLGL